jgi:SAM-dependent methyltransferase
MKAYAEKVYSIYRSLGLMGILNIIRSHIYPKRAKCLLACKSMISNKSGLEIGGPSALFSKRGLLPFYPFLQDLDNCNFAIQTIWEGEITAGYTFQYDKDKSCGRQYVLDATNLKEIPSSQYDFILSSHVIEHIANPLKAISEWCRVIKDDGVLIIIIPFKNGTFDHDRKVTTLEHLIEDYNKDTQENDLTHLAEILKYHDLRMDPGAGEFEKFKLRSINNYENRCLHHHVFDISLAGQLFEFMKLQILAVEQVLPYDIIVFAKKSAN